MRFGGFGPFRPEWSLLRMPGLGMPFIGVLGLDVEEMSWGTRPEDVLPFLPPGSAASKACPTPATSSTSNGPSSSGA